jgi:hypothetical protein
VKQTYHRSAGYFEIDVDIGCGNMLVQSILNVVRDKAKWLTVDLHFVIQGENEVGFEFTSLNMTVIAAVVSHNAVSNCAAFALIVI